MAYKCWTNKETCQLDAALSFDFNYWCKATKQCLAEHYGDRTAAVSALAECLEKHWQWDGVSWREVADSLIADVSTP